MTVRRYVVMPVAPGAEGDGSEHYVIDTRPFEFGGTAQVLATCPQAGNAWHIAEALNCEEEAKGRMT